MRKITEKIALDVDQVCSDFTQGFVDAAHELGYVKEFPKKACDVTQWDFGVTPDVFKTVWDSIERSYKFWLSLRPIKSSQKFFATKKAFVPDCYITKRPIPSWVTAKWLRNNGFPESEVITVSQPDEKIAILKERNVDAFVDDLPSTTIGCRLQGINAILFRASHQQAKEIKGLPMISSLSELSKLDFTSWHPALIGVKRKE